MANTRGANVIRVDTSAAFGGPLFIDTIKYVGASSASASVKKVSSSGNILWQAAGSSEQTDSDIGIKCGGGVYVTITNGATVFLYLK